MCISDDSSRTALQGGLPPRLVQTIHNGIDLERFSPAGPAPDGPAVIVARLAPEKDVATLLRAAAVARSAQPDFRLEIAGDGPCRTELERLAAELGLADGVRFLGPVRDVPALLRRARLFVLSSLTEGISLTLLEAMASALPVVATRVGGNGEVVTEGETGLLIPAGDPAALAEGMLALWNDPGRRVEMGRAARRRVEEEFDVRRMVARYENLYEQLTGG